MQNKLILMSALSLLTCVAVAQQSFESVEDIMNELMTYSDEPAAEDAVTPPVTRTEKPESIQVKDQSPSDQRQIETPVAVDDSEMSTQADERSMDEVRPSGEEDAFESDSEAPAEDDPQPVSSEEIDALARSLDIETDELLLLLDQTNQNEKDAIEALQRIVDLIENEPDEGAAKKNLITWFKNAPSATWTLLKDAGLATKTLFQNTPAATAVYLDKLREDRNKRKMLGRDHRKVEIEGMQAVDAAWSTDLVLRTYDLVSGASKKMQLEGVKHAMDVEMLFSVVNFPKGASAIYQPETETIYVKNTLENLDVMETMLESMEILKGYEYAYQIEIEAKFVEVSEGTLEELGFQWNFEDPTAVGSKYEMNDGPDGLFSEALRGTPPDSTLPFDRKIDLGDGTVSASGDWSTFRFADTFNTEPSGMSVENRGGNPFELLISALNQSTGADVLSAPRILTRNGEEAVIQVGEIHYFPEVFEGDSAQATIVNVSYEDFEEKMLGIELTVTPKVNDDREIMLELNPRITELAGWQQYQLAPEDSLYNHRQRDTNLRFDHDPIIAKLPILKKREIKTQITMADGSTIGMGGLINEKVETFEDRVPVMGSIPFVGRLFRSEGERVVKRNLLMFVTARVVDPNGRIDASKSLE